MYPYSLYLAFVQLRKQLYKAKKRKILSRYSQIELNKRKFKTFQKFYNEAQEWIYDWDRDLTTQEVFDDMLDASQSKGWIKCMCYD